MPSDESLYERMLSTLFATWELIAESAEEASVRRSRGAVAAVFPAGPKRLFLNNAVLARGLDRADVGEAVEGVANAYEEAGVERYAVWAHDSEEPAIAELESRGLSFDTSTCAMAMSLDEIAVPPPDIELGPADWDEYLRIIDVPDGTFSDLDPATFHLLVARLDGQNVSAAVAYDHRADCSIFSLATLPNARRQGLGTALTALHLHQARERGCTTASLQSTPEAEGVYRSVGFRDLGRFVEYVP